MLKYSKRIISVIISIVIFTGCVCFSFAENSDNTVTGQLNFTTFNVDGLPIPSALSSTKRDPLKATKLIAKQINTTDIDMLAVQEDFDFHSILADNINMKYKTLTSGGAGVGDGLNIFSKYPIYNVGRVAWKTECGVFNNGSDELTPKGILYCTAEIADGVYVDIYNIHADASEDKGSLQAKAEQYDQLVKLIDEHSGSDRAVMITGDFNFNFALFREAYANGSMAVDLYTKVMDDFINQGFKDAWIEYNNGGNYGYSYGDLYQKYGGDYVRTWDTLDHVFYRSGTGISLDISNAYYDGFDTNEITWNGHLSDHAALRTTISYTADLNKVTAPQTLKTESFNLSSYISNIAKHVVSALYKIIVNLPSLVSGGIGWQK